MTNAMKELNLPQSRIALMLFLIVGVVGQSVFALYFLILYTGLVLVLGWRQNKAYYGAFIPMTIWSLWTLFS